LRFGANRFPDESADRERALILRCCGIPQSEPARAAIAMLAGGAIDWQRLTALIAQNSVAPLVASRLLDPECRAPLPAAVARQLTLAREATALRNQHLAACLHRIVEILGREKIPVLAIKGPVAAAAAYHDLSLRSFGDLDVLIPRADVTRAVGALAGLGYASKSWRADAFASPSFPIPRSIWRLPARSSICTGRSPPITFPSAPTTNAPSAMRSKSNSRAIQCGR
jgi:hypothetical protein